MVIKILMASAFILMDCTTGYTKALMNKTVSSKIMREGLFHKFGFILAIALSVLIDYAQTLIDLGVNIPLTTGICAYIILTEIISICENIKEINPAFDINQILKFFSKKGGEK